MRIFLCLLAAGLWPVCLRAVEPLPVQYTVSFSDADRHVIDVEAVLPTDGQAELTVMMPVWTPGSYVVREYPRNIEVIRATEALSTEALAIRKTAKNRWLIDNPEQDPAVRIRYRLYCREMSVRTNWVERDFGVLNGAATFVTLADSVPRPHQVHYSLPPRWQHAICALTADPVQKHSFMAASFDELVDSPVVLGNPKIASFSVDNVEHQLVTINDDDLWDNDAAAKDVQRIVEVQRDFWGQLPYERYLFLNVVGESRGGLEHDNSTLLMTSRWAFRDPDRYRLWLGLVSHELFHAWNVRRLRPRALLAYDYEQEMLFDELWIAEGVTSYYDDLLQVRAGLLSQKDYFERLSQTLKSVMTAPGGDVQALRESSYDAWIKFYRPDENAVNARISYYTKGSLVAWLLDAKIRAATDGKRSLDDVMRLLYQQHAGEGGGYDLADFRRIVDQVSGQPLSEFLEAAVDTAEPLDFSVALERWGLSLGVEAAEDATKDAKAAAAAEVHLAAAATAEPPKEPYVGATLAEEDGRMVITSVVRGTPADRAGWNVDDELLALGEFRVTPSLWKDELAQFETETEITCLLARRGRLIHRTITLEPHRADQWKLQSEKKPSKAQQKQRQQWLAQPAK